MHDLIQKLRGNGDAVTDLAVRYGRGPLSAAQWYSRKCMFGTLVLIGLIGIPALYMGGLVSIETVNQLGRYLCFAIAALSLDLIWGYGGMLCLCQSLFFSLGGYAMGMYCAHHGGPEGIVDAVNWGKMPACLFVVYPGQVGESQEQWTVPFFWKPFWNLWTTIILGVLIPGIVAALIGFFVFRSRVRGVFFAVLTQAIVLAIWLVFCMNNMKLGGTNGLTRFDRVILGAREQISIVVTPDKLAERSIDSAAVRQAVDSAVLRLDEAYTQQVGRKREMLAEQYSSPPTVDVDAAPITLQGDDTHMQITLARSMHVWKTLREIERLEVSSGVRLSDIAEVSVCGFNLNNDNVKLGLYALTVVVLVTVFLLCRLLMKSRVGRVLIAIRDNESRLRFSGYRPYVFKMLIFGLSGAIAGLAGMLYAPQMKIFTPTNLEPKESIGVVIFVAVGGRATLSGPIIGALAVSYLYSWLTSNSPDAWPIVLGLLFVLATLYLPGGVMGIWHSWLSLPLGNDINRRQPSVAEELTGDQKRWDTLIAIAGVLTLVIGMLTAFGIWEHARPYGDGLMAQRNGSSVVVGLMLILTALCALLQVPAGAGILMGRAWGLTVSRWTLMLAVGLIAATFGWSFFVDTLRSGVGGWTSAGFKRSVDLIIALPHVAVLAMWSIVALVFFEKAVRKRGVIETSAADAVPEGMDWTQYGIPTVKDREERLQKIMDRQRIGPKESLLDSPLLHVQQVKVLFDGFKALDVQDFSVGHYDLNVIIGPNGAGKTTLCDVISGKTRATEGHIQFAGQDITELLEADIARLGVGRKFQTPTVFDSLTVYQNMELALPGRDRLIHNFGDKASREEHTEIEKILRRVNLLEHSGREVRYLSHGQRQWLEISMLILSKPRLLLVDEPAAGLTDEETILTAELLLELKDEHSVIVIEHDMEFVRLLNSRVTVLNEGSIMAQGDIEQIQQNPEVIEAYLGR